MDFDKVETGDLLESYNQILEFLSFLKKEENIDKE